MCILRESDKVGKCGKTLTSGDSRGNLYGTVLYCSFILSAGFRVSNEFGKGKKNYIIAKIKNF